MLFGSVPAWRVIRNTLAVASILGLTMCENIDNIDIATAGKVTIPKATLVDKLLGKVAFSNFDKVDFSESFQNQGVTPDQVDSVHVRVMTILVEAPNGGNLDFIQSLHFFVKAEGLPKIPLGSKEMVPKGKREINLDIDTGSELKPYVTAPSMQIMSEVEGSLPDQDMVIAAAVVLDVDIRVSGCK